MQRALMQYWLPRNHAIVRKALRIAHREDLIGYGTNALVPPAAQEATNHPRGGKRMAVRSGREHLQGSIGEKTRKTRKRR